MKRKIRRRRTKSPPEVDAQSATQNRLHAFETNFKLTEQAYPIPCGSATSSARLEQLESLASDFSGATSDDNREAALSDLQTTGLHGRKKTASRFWTSPDAEDRDGVTHGNAIAP
jgi:hypothetical protein